MIPQPYFRLTRQAVLLGIIAVAFPATAYCVAAGRADFVVGKVEAVAASGSRRVLIKGSEINPGDAISTAAEARAQLRFTDGGFVSLQPNTVFRIDQFNYQNKTDGQEKGFFSLLKGGLRAITGAIGHVNRGAYQVNTPVATIGIRGTGYNAVLDDGLLVSVGEGAVSLTNNGGTLVVGAGGAGYVANANVIPVPTSLQPRTPPAALQPTATPVTAAQFAAGEQRDASGHLLVVTEGTPANLVSGSGYAMTYAYLDCNDGCIGYGTNVLTGVDAEFNSSSQLVKYGTSQSTGAQGDASITSAGNDGIIGWGRWEGNTDPQGTSPHPLTTGVFHYVVGMPTVSMPVAGHATYTMIGATIPSASDGSTGWSVASGAHFTAYFDSNEVYIDSMTVANSAHTYALSSGNSPLILSNASFSGSVNTTGCTSGCTTSINGFFAGGNATRAGLAYSIIDTLGPEVQGAAAFAGGGIQTSNTLSTNAVVSNPVK
jgi:hypothetical protein